MANGLNVDIGVTLARLEREMAKVVKMGVNSAVQVENRWEQANRSWVASTQRAGSQIQKIIAQQTGAGGSTPGGFEKRAKDIEMFGQELDDLRAKYDPVFAASKRYETSFNELNRAHRVGAINARQYESALELLNQEYAQAAAQSNVTSDATVRSFKRSGFAVANLSAQLNDIGVSLAGGQSPFQVMIQQGTQVSQIFQQTGGNFRAFSELLKGSILGILNPFSLATFAIIGFGGALVQWLTAADDASDDTKDAVEELKSAIDAYATAAEAASKSSADLVEEYGDMASEARELAQQQKQLAETEAIVAIEAAVQKVTQAYRDYQDAVSSAARRGGVSIFENEPIEDFAAALGVTEQQAASLGEKLRDLDAQTAVADTLTIIRQITEELEEAGANTATASAESRELYSDFLDLEQAAIRLVAESRGLAPELMAAAEAANAVWAAMSAAADAAAEMSKNSAQALSDARLRLTRRDDPVGLAGELAGRNFDRKVGDTTGFDPILQQGLRAQREEIVANEEATKKATMALAEYQKQQRSTGRRSGGGRGGQSPEDRFSRQTQSVEFEIRNMEQQYEALLRVNPLLNDYGQALDYANTRQKLLNDAERAGLELTPERITAIEALSQRHAEASAQLKELQTEQQNFTRAIEDFKNTAADALKGFISDLREGKSASEALGNALERIADKLLDSGIDSFINAAFSGVSGSRSSAGGGGGFLGGILSFIPKLFGFREGGYTGNGRPDDVAGYVHKREFVFDAEATKRIGVDRLEKMRKGFRDGGFVGAGGPRAVPMSPSGPSSSGGDYINVTGQFSVVNGELIPLMTAVSGQVAGRQLKQADDRFSNRANKQQTRGI